jgi:hypothetical protein
MASFETQRRDQSAWQHMAVERRAATDRLAAASQRARQLTHRANMAAAREAAERRQEEDRARAAALARAREHQYPSPPSTSTRTPSSVDARLVRTAAAVALPPPHLAWATLAATTSSR